MIAIMHDFLDHVFANASIRALAVNDRLFSSGETVVSVFLIRSGRVDLVRYSGDGQKMILAHAGPGDIVAEASAYSETYHCDAIVAAGGEAAAVARSSFRERLREDPDLADQWAHHLAVALRNARARTEMRSLRRVADRLDAWLAAGNEFPPHGHLQDVAAEIGVTREALYRALSARRS